MPNRIELMPIPTNLANDENMIKLFKTNGWITYFKYGSLVNKPNKNELVKVFRENGFIVAVATSDELNLSIGVSRKGLVEYHKNFEKLKMAKVYSTSYGYVVILGIVKFGIGRYFIGDEGLFDSEISKIEKIKEGVSEGNVSLGNTYNNISLKESKDIVPVRRVKKLKKIKDTEKKPESILDKLKEIDKKGKKEPSEYEQSIEKRKESIQNPSKKKIYQKHKSLEIDEWGCEDFLGYYLNEYVDMFGSEDTDFVNLARSKTKMLLMNMGKFKQAYFPNDNEEFKKYIKWAMDYIASPDTWIDSAPSIYSITINNLAKKLVKEYKVNRTKTKVTGRVQKDSEYSEEDYWKQKYLKK